MESGRGFSIFISMIFLAILVYLIFLGVSRYLFLPTDSSNQGLDSSNIKENDIEIIATDLNIPWEIAFLPDGDMLVTERPGNLLRIDENKSVIKVEGVYHTGEGGLLGLAIHPRFSDNNYIYLYMTTKTDSGTINRVERYKLLANILAERKVIIDNIPGSSFHDGGRIAFGPDRLLYITTGDAGNEQSAQDTSLLAGKILRLNDDGSIPASNPFNNPVYSYGHRNPQGITWGSRDYLWATEHGRSGLESGLDEINIIVAGKNYGWPVIQGDSFQPGMVTPVINSGEDSTWAPASVIYYEGSLFFTGLRGESLYQAVLDGERVIELKSHFRREYGRLRAITLGPDGYFYISTSNTDGRGSAAFDDDKIIKVNPEVFS